MSEVSQFIAISIAEGRIKKAREKLRDRLLQQAELSPERRIVEDDEGVETDILTCPACDALDHHDGRGGGYIEVPSPFGLEARERTSYEVNIKGMPDDVLLWAIKNHVYKLSLNTKSFDVYSEDPSPESLYMMGIIGSQTHMRREIVPTLNVLNAAKLKEEAQ